MYGKNSSFWDDMKANPPFDETPIPDPLIGDFPEGKPKVISSPEQLWGYACDYFKWADENPLYKTEMHKSGEYQGTTYEMPLRRAYTWQGFDVFVITKRICGSLSKYRYNYDGAYSEFVKVIEIIHSVMYSQKFEGAASGLFNANIISQDLGMVKKKEVAQTIIKPIRLILDKKTTLTDDFDE